MNCHRIYSYNSFSSPFLFQLGVNPTSVDSVELGQGNDVKMKPGQRLCFVNQLYQYTIQFKEDLTGNHGGTKRPRESASEDRESQRVAPSVKAPKQTEDLSASVKHDNVSKGNVREWIHCTCT